MSPTQIFVLNVESHDCVNVTSDTGNYSNRYYILFRVTRDHHRFLWGSNCPLFSFLCSVLLKMKKKITPLWEQFQSPIEKYHTVGTVPKSNRKIVERSLFVLMFFIGGWGREHCIVWPPPIHVFDYPFGIFKHSHNQLEYNVPKLELD